MEGEAPALRWRRAPSWSPTARQVPVMASPALSTRRGVAACPKQCLPWPPAARPHLAGALRRVPAAAAPAHHRGSQQQVQVAAPVCPRRGWVVHLPTCAALVYSGSPPLDAPLSSRPLEYKRCQELCREDAWCERVWVETGKRSFTSGDCAGALRHLLQEAETVPKLKFRRGWAPGHGTVRCNLCRLHNKTSQAPWEESSTCYPPRPGVWVTPPTPAAAPACGSRAAVA
ncbi:uncharacterized protein LOC123632575 [Lemur catta]|uniref:uncharacterized protein LOC123632575 n=1 Tax=Lemur catta TaxID=9447 RepID=UPI001E269387|nr:uncharacterized protein LOC123632575 [Lemur catta]